MTWSLDLELTARLAPRPLPRDAPSNLVRRKSVAPGLRAPLIDGNELGPVLHLHASHKPILAVLGLENRCFAFLHIEPVLAQGIDDVGFVRDEESVFALFGHLRQHLAKRRGSSAIFVR